MADHDEIREENNRIPMGWKLFFGGVIIWMVYYIIAFTPEISGWTQYAKLEKAMRDQTPPATAREHAAVNPYVGDEAATGEGEALYGQNCAVCHGDDLKGGVGVDLTGQLSYGETDALLFESVANGRPGGMPPFLQQLGRDRIWHVLAYVSSKRS